MRFTRSGTNKLHGNLFEYLRNSALDAKNYFDPATNRIPPFSAINSGEHWAGRFGTIRHFSLGRSRPSRSGWSKRA